MTPRDQMIAKVQSHGGYEFMEGHWLFKNESDRAVKSLEDAYRICFHWKEGYVRE